MKAGNSHYPGFDVMKEKENWDPHTREIVEKRLEQSPFQTLSLDESITLTHISARLLDESRDPVLHYVVSHFDQSLTSNIGESERKASIPKAAVLIRQGLRAIDQYSTREYGAFFAGLKKEEQIDLLNKMKMNQIELSADGVQIPAKELFYKLLNESVAAYYSHPTVWSEIGYAGPAYPRGYVRTEWGITDPWEAKREDAES